MSKGLRPLSQKHLVKARLDALRAQLPRQPKKAPRGRNTEAVRIAWTSARVLVPHLLDWARRAAKRPLWQRVRKRMAEGGYTDQTATGVTAWLVECNWTNARREWPASKESGLCLPTENSVWFRNTIMRKWPASREVTIEPGCMAICPNGASVSIRIQLPTFCLPLLSHDPIYEHIRHMPESERALELLDHLVRTILDGQQTYLFYPV